MTVRGRVGVPFGMLRTGGLAVTNLKASVVFVGDPVTNVAAAGISETHTGWTAGGGVEWAFARNWSVKAEYLYADFGSVSFVSAFNVDPDFTYTHDGSDRSLRGQLQVRLDGPVTARKADIAHCGAYVCF